MNLDDVIRLFPKQPRKQGTGYMAVCPAHADRNPSLHISEGDERVLLHCFAGCAVGDICAALGIEVKDLFYGDRTDWRSSKWVRPAPPPPPEDRVLMPSEVETFWHQRGIDLQTVIDAGVWADDDNAIRFPLTRDGKLINIKTRYLPKKFSLTEGAEKIWWGLDWCKGQSRIVICEGEIDLLTYRQAGVKAVLSPPNGAQWKEMDFFGSAAEIFERAEVVILAIENDEAGTKFTEEVARRIGPEKCKRVVWPEGCKDANDVLLTFGIETVRALLREAEPFPVTGIIRPGDLREQYLKLYREGLPRGRKTRWENLNRYFSILDQYMTIVTGTPNSGKSEWLDALLVDQILDYDLAVAMFSPENRPAELHLSRWAEKFIGEPFLPGKPSRMTEDDAERALIFAEEHVSLIAPEEPTLDELLRLFRAEVIRNGVKIIVIDPWNEILHKRPSNQREDEYLSQELRKVRQFCERHQCHCFIVVHPHAMEINKSTGQYPVVDFYDLNGGAMWSNKIDAMVSLWRDKEDWTAPVQAHMKKARNRIIGTLGEAHLSFNRMNGRYADVPGGWKDKG